MEDSSLSHRQKLSIVCSNALWLSEVRTHRPAEPKHRRYDLIPSMFPSAVRSLAIKTRSEAHTCVPVGKAWHANCNMTFAFGATKMSILRRGRWLNLCAAVLLLVAPWTGTRTHTYIHNTITYTDTDTQWVWLILLWLCGYLPVFQMKLEWREVPACLSVLISVTHHIHLLRLVAFCKHFFIKQYRGTGSLTTKHKKTYCCVEAMQKWPGLRLLSSPCQLGAAPLRCWDAISTTGELFIYLFNLIILAEWRYDGRWTNTPTQVDAVHAQMRVCALIKTPHTSEHGSGCRFIGAPRALDAYISPYQRTLIAPSMSEQIHVRTSIHKASLVHTVCPPCPIFLLLFTRMWLHIWDSLRHNKYTHIQ